MTDFIKRNDLIKFIKSDSIEKVKQILQDQIDQSDLNWALVIACRKKKVEMIKLLIEHGADIHFNRESGLEAAIMKSDRNLIDLLISLGADLQLVIKDRLDFIISKCTGEIIDYLFSIGMEVTKEMLKRTAEEDNLEGFKAILKQISDTDLSEVWLVACQNENGSIKIIDYLLDLLPADFDIANSDLYHIIGSDNDLAVFKKLLNRIPNPQNLVNVRYLKAASFFSRYEIVKIILELGVDPNSENPVSTLFKYYQHDTVLECAIGGHIPSMEIIKLLLNYGVNVTIKCLEETLSSEWDIFYLIYQSGQWSTEQLSRALCEMIKLGIDDDDDEKIYKFLQKEIGFELETKYLTEIINECIYYGHFTIFEYFANFYGKDTLLDLVPFAVLVNYLLDKNRSESFEYVLNFYGRETVMSMIDYSVSNDKTKEYLEKFKY